VDDMSKTCTKCKNPIAEDEELDPKAEGYPCCNKCWSEWKEYQVIVMNEMRLDMSLPDHRKLLRKNEQIFVGVRTAEGDTVDFSDEKNRNPEESS
jgi:Fe-S cluster biosynthesis and repair protein YggX